jgi:hypothetical protein
MNKKQRFIKEWIDTQQIVNCLVAEMLKIIELINSEAKRLEKQSETVFIREIQPWFRIEIRSVIATIEAICYKLKQVTVLICDQRNKSLTQAEREKLLEKKIDEHGKPKDYYLKTEENIKFTLKMIYYAFDLSFEIKDHEGWKKLRNTIKVRHKLTHPKNKKDLEIFLREYEDAEIGFNWFVRKIGELSSAWEHNSY